MLLRIFLSFLLLLSFQTIPALAADEKPSRQDVRKFIRDRLTDSIQLLDKHFRVPETGQYLDVVRIGEKDQSNLPSSIAATGIGLVSLAIGDALGVLDDAEAKAIHTLRNLLNQDQKSGFKIDRSRNGWYPHFVDPYTGETRRASEGKYSTIDTALLSAGVAIAARYFSAKSYTRGKGESRVFLLGGQVVGRVRWASAIKDVDRGLVHLVFNGDEETPLDRVFATPFDEYAMLPCIAKRGEQLAGRQGRAHDLFTKHYSNAKTLPMNDFRGHPVIGKRNGSFIAHFTHLFVYYYCNDINRQGAYRASLRQMAEADRKHFHANENDLFPKHLWGLGAGAEIKFDENGKVRYSAYGVNHLGKNPNNTASPAIMAGLAPVFNRRDDNDPILDLYKLWKNRTCVYNHEGIEFLWRCSARNTDLKVTRVEAVDFSTYLLGLAGRDPAIGMAFFRHFNL